MDFKKVTYENGKTVINAQNMNDIQDAIIELMERPSIDTSDATAAADDIAEGETAYVNGEKVTGTLGETSMLDLSGNAKEVTALGSDAIGIIVSPPSRTIVSKDTSITARANVDQFGDATASDVASGKTFTSSAGLKVVGTGQPGGSSAGLAMKSGTTNSNVIETGLSSIKYLVLYKGSINAVGLVHLIYRSDEGKSSFVYCSSYSDYIRSCSVSSTSIYATVDGGTFTWEPSSDNMAMTADTTYSWIAFGYA